MVRKVSVTIPKPVVDTSDKIREGMGISRDEYVKRALIKFNRSNSKKVTLGSEQPQVIEESTGQVIRMGAV